MKKGLILSIIAGVLLLGACSPKYLSKGVLSGSFNKGKTYKAVIMPPVTIDMKQKGNNSISEMGYKNIVSELSSVSAFVVTGNFRGMRKQANTYKYGAMGNADFTVAIKVAKAMGANAVVISKISKEKANLPVRVNIEIYDINETMLYNGQGRAANPASAEAETELAVEFALKQLKKKAK